MPFPNIDPIAFAIGPVVVRWYALAYLIGVLGGAAYATTLLRRHGLWKDNRPPFEPAAIWDFAFWAVVGIIIGGRVGYVLFYNLGYYAANPGEIIALWDGGMSFHGGLVGIMLAMALFVRSKGGNILSGMDLLGAIGTIGLFLGRVANFINAELYGAPTTLPWAVVFPTNSCRAIPASSTRRCSKACCCSSSSASPPTTWARSEGPGSSPAFSASAMRSAASSSSSSACPTPSSAISMAAGSPWAWC